MNGHTIDIHSQTQQLELNTNLTVPCESKSTAKEVSFEWSHYRIKFPESNVRISIGNSMICSDIWHKYHK